MKKKWFAVSLVLNIFFVLFGAYLLYQKGGMAYLKNKFSTGEKQKVEREGKKASNYGHYHNSKKSIFEIMPNDTNAIIMLGNSLTDYCDWNELFGKTNIKNRGINGDVIEAVIDRLDEMVEGSPKKVFLEIGINDLAQQRTVAQIERDYEKLLVLIRQKSPKTQLFVQSMVPVYKRKEVKTTDILALNKCLVNLAEKYSLTYVNLFDLLKNNKNELDPSYSFDGVHLNGKGYLVWKRAISAFVED